MVWEVLNEEQLGKPLREYMGSDILTDDTLRDIKDNNDILSD